MPVNAWLTRLAMGAAEKAVGNLPLRGRLAEKTSHIEERRSEAERALAYVELYGSYAETEARFRIDRTLALQESLDPADRKEWCFDPAVIDWTHYVREVHLPSVVEHGRVRTTPGKRSGPSREERGRAAILTIEPRCAVFDLENTLIASNVVESYAWLASRHLDPADKLRLVAQLVGDAPRLLALDRRDRSDFLRSFYRRYDGAPAARTAADGWELLGDLIITRSFPEGIARVRHHRRLGHRTLLITGALDFVVEPLRPLFDEIVAARLGAILIEEWASSLGLSLEQTVAYADSTSDLPMLEASGHPVAVNPEAKLATIARRRGWLVEHWSKAPGGPRRPLAVSTRRLGPRTAPAATSSAGGGR